jgi:hypothetical protein
MLSKKRLQTGVALSVSWDSPFRIFSHALFFSMNMLRDEMLQKNWGTICVNAIITRRHKLQMKMPFVVFYFQ